MALVGEVPQDDTARRVEGTAERATVDCELLNNGAWGSHERAKEKRPRSAYGNFQRSLGVDAMPTRGFLGQDWPL